MPYIESKLRAELNNRSPLTCGELNYKITTLITYYLNQKGKNYSNYNEVVGVLECAKLELYRRLIANYENKKSKDNGDVYND
jgi:hypothetical protein